MTKDERRAIQPMIDEVNVPREPKAFKVADNVGFNVMFTNEWEVSVRWSEGHSCDGGKTTVEVAVFDPEENWYTLDDDDKLCRFDTDIMGHVTPETLTRILQEVAKQ